MKRPAKLLFAACLTTIIAAGSSTTPAAESDSPAQVLVQVDIPDQAMAAYWTRLPDAYGLRVVLDQPQPASSTSGEVQRPSDANVDEALTRSDRSSFFIGTTIENLRGLNPTFSCRTLTSVDGRRAVSKQQLAPAHPDQPYYFPYQSADPTRYKDPRVDVWLLQADGTQVMGRLTAANMHELTRPSLVVTSRFCTSFPSRASIRP